VDIVHHFPGTIVVDSPGEQKALQLISLWKCFPDWQRAGRHSTDPKMNPSLRHSGPVVEVSLLQGLNKSRHSQARRGAKQVRATSSTGHFTASRSGRCGPKPGRDLTFLEVDVPGRS